MHRGTSTKTAEAFSWIFVPFSWKFRRGERKIDLTAVANIDLLLVEDFDNSRHALPWIR